MGFARLSELEMKLSLKTMLLLLAFSIPTFANDTPFDWSGLERSKISLEAPLLIIKGSLGFLGCGYINTDTCNDTGEACAVVSGVKTHEEMLEATIESVSLEAMALGVKVGMEGTEAIELFR